MLEIRNVANLDDDRAVVEAMGAFRFKVIESDMKDGYHVARWEQINDLSPEEQSYQERMEIMTATARIFKAKNKASASMPAPGSGPAFGPAMLSLGTMIVAQGQAWASRSSQGSSQHTKSQQLSAADELTELEMQTTDDIIVLIRQFIDSFRASDTQWVQQHTSRFGPAPDSPNAFVWWAAMTIPLSEQEKYKLLQVNTTRERAKLLMTWINALKQKWWFPS
jgi:Lon protease-like protein